MLQKNVDPQTVKQILPAIYAGIVAAVCWIAGDILIVGFTPSPEKYPLFSETYASRVDADLATLMLSGSTSRLMWGALLAVFSVPLYIYAVLGVSKAIHRKFTMPVLVPLFAGMSYSPLGHAGFFYVGEIYKAILNTDAAAHEQLLQTAAGFVKVLEIVWTASVSLMGLGWLIFGILVARGKTWLKPAAFWLNPIVFFIGTLLLTLLLPSPLKDWIACAAFNEALLIFFVVLLIYCKETANNETHR
ncbi:DUF6796 family protein [Neisseria sp.]|uniref:DUF6796 family protein n=1 Tax=Neisseria sp. TaxID=192066 RepID=UPI0026DBF5EA|nr:DUF6796 family protein [Neisseria sp.]MDO4226694.1 hypothetical protein [Neisseria sp.]